jgi:hypothetical protein
MASHVLDADIDDFTLSQVCAAMENEHFAFVGLEELTIGNFAILGECDMDLEEQKPLAKAESARFGPEVTDAQLKELITSQENGNTKNNTKWAVNVFEKWRGVRSEDNIPEFHEMNGQEMNFWLQRFVVEARRQDGKEYPPKSLYLIVCGLLRYLRDKDVHDKNFLDEKNVDFVHFRKVLDAQMKTLLDKGFGTTVKQADPIMPDDEDKLWTDKVFGMDTAEQLQKTVFFYASKLFGLRGCDEHHDLKCEQFSIGEDNMGKFIQFVGRSTKTYKGGLGQMNVTNKNIKHHSQSGEFVLFVFYIFITYFIMFVF